MAHLTLLHGVFYRYNTTILGPAWYMGTEWLCILVSPLVMFLIMNHMQGGGIKGICLLLVTQLMGLWFSRDRDMLQHIVRNFPLFLSGILIGKVFLEGSKKLLIYAVLTLMVLYLILLDYKQNWLSCFFILGIYILVIEKGKCKLLEIIKRMLEQPWISGLARLSYPLYMLHMIAIPVAFSMSLYVLHLEGFWLCFVAALLAIILLGVMAIAADSFQKKILCYKVQRGKE